jgi:molecular chaperone Hsp33
MLQSLGRAEINSILVEQGAVTVTCEFCQRPYTFDAVDAGQLFLEVPAAEPPNSVN